MSVAKHLKEHSMLGLIGPNTYQATIGNGGRFSSIADALTLRSSLSHTLLETKTAAASTTGNYGDREISLGSALASTYGNRLVIAKVASTGCYFMCRVRTTTSIIAKHPILTSFSNQDISIYDPVFFNIHIQPGTVLDVSATMTNIPDCISFTGIRGTHQIRFTQAGTVALFSMAADATLVSFNGLNIANRESALTQIMFQFSSPAARGELTEFSIRNCDVHAAASDIVYFPDALNGYCEIVNNSFSGHYDIIRATQHKRLDILNNVMSARDWSGEQIACCVAVDTVGTAASEVNIRGNTLVAEAEDEAALGTTSLVYPVDIRSLGSASKVSVQNNKIKALAHDGAEAVVGVGCYTTTATVTPEVNVIGNVFDCNRTGGGATIYTIDNVNANYSFKRGSNIAVAGSVATVGANTTAATLF